LLKQQQVLDAIKKRGDINEMIWRLYSLRKQYEYAKKYLSVTFKDEKVLPSYMNKYENTIKNKI